MANQASSGTSRRFSSVKDYLLLFAAFLLGLGAAKYEKYMQIRVQPTVVVSEGAVFGTAALAELKAAGIAGGDYRAGILSVRGGLSSALTVFEGTSDREHFPDTTRAYSINLADAEPALIMQCQPMEHADRTVIIAAVIQDLEQVRAGNAAWLVRAQEYQQQSTRLQKLGSLL